MSTSQSPVVFSDDRSVHPNEAFDADRHVPLDQLPCNLTLQQLRHVLLAKYQPATADNVRDAAKKLVDSIKGMPVHCLLAASQATVSGFTQLRPATALLIRELVAAVFPEAVEE